MVKVAIRQNILFVKGAFGQSTFVKSVTRQNTFFVKGAFAR
jgi:hypothetical protein